MWDSKTEPGRAADGFPEMVSVSSVFLESFTKQTGSHFDMLQFCEGFGNFVNPAACSREVNLREVRPFLGGFLLIRGKEKEP